MKKQIFSKLIYCLFIVFAYLSYIDHTTTVVLAETDVIIDDVITDKVLNETKNKIEITGNLPGINIAEDPNLQKEVNDYLDNIFTNSISNAQRSNSSELKIDYVYAVEDGIYSIAITSTTNNGITRERINSVNFDVAFGKVLSINDMLGYNGVDLANKYLEQEVIKNPENFKTSFPEIDNTTDFFLSEGKLYLLFDQNRISNKMISVKDNLYLKIDNVIDVVLNKNEYKTQEDFGLKLVPIRLVAEELGYQVTWNDETRSVITEKDEFLTTITIGKNSYDNGMKSRSLNSTRELESPPKFIDGVVYVPISFFGSILEETYYITSNGKIIISTYNI